MTDKIEICPLSDINSHIHPNQNNSPVNSQMIGGPNLYPTFKQSFDNIMLDSKIYWQQKVLFASDDHNTSHIL